MQDDDAAIDNDTKSVQTKSGESGHELDCVRIGSMSSVNLQHAATVGSSEGTSDGPTFENMNTAMGTK